MDKLTAAELDKLTVIIVVAYSSKNIVQIWWLYIQ